MSLLGFDSTGTATINGLNNIYCQTLYSDDTYINNSTNPINVGDALDALQAEIDAINSSIVGIQQGNYFVGASNNNPNNSLSEKKLYFNQLVALNNFTLVGSGTSATQIRADASGVYNIWYKINYQKVDATTSYEVRTWLMKNNVDVDYTTTIQTMSTQAQWMTVTNQYTLTLNQNDYVEIVWLSANAAATNDILDFIGATSPYPQVSSQTVIVSQIMNTSAGKSDEIAVGTTTTLAAGSAATVTDTTTIFPSYTLHTLNFGIPKGDQGAVGPAGPQGPQGPQGPKGDQGDTNATATAALILATSAQATAIAAGAAAASAISANTAQDIIISANSGAISTLQDQVLPLIVKTQDMSWGTLTGTTFSRTVHINNTGAGIGGDAVTLDSSSPADFLYGINNLKVVGSLTVDDFLYVSRNNRNAKKIVLYDGNSGNDYNYSGLWSSSSGSSNFLNFEIDNDAGSAYRYYYGNVTGTSRSLIKELKATSELSYTDSSTFLKKSGFSQQIKMSRDLSANTVTLEMIGDTAGANVWDGQIIQEKGNSFDNDSGTMTIQSGNINLNSMNNKNIALTSTAQINMTSQDEINISGNTILGSVNLSTDTSDISLTAAGSITGVAGNEITLTSNRAAFPAITMTTNTTGSDLILTNATSADFLIEGTGNLSLNSGGSMNFNSGPNVFNIDSGDALNLTSNSLNIITTTALNITGGTDILTDATGLITFTSSGSTASMVGTNTGLTATAGNVTLLASGNISATATSGTASIVGNTGATIEADSGITLVSNINGDIDIVSYGNTELTNGGLTVNCSSIVDMTSTSNFSITSSAGVVLITGDAEVSVTVPNGDFTVSSTDVDIQATTGAMTLNGYGGTNLTTTDGVINITSGGVNGVYTSGDEITTIATGSNIILNANSAGGNLYLKQNNNNKIAISSSQTTHSQNVQMNNNLTLNAASQFNFIPAGTIHMSVASAVPTGYLRCNGNAVSRSTYSVLFAAIGTTFGAGDGLTTFNVPDFEGAFLRGAGSSTVGGVTYTGAAIGTAQQDQVLSANYASNQGFRDCAGGARECVARSRITGDPTDTNTGILAQFARQGSENRPFNFSVHYNIKF
jgi:hypothetical protein